MHYSKSLFVDEDDVPSQFTSKAVCSQFLRSSVMMDGVPSKVNVLLQIVSNPESMFFLWKVSNPESLAPKIARGLDWVHRVSVSYNYDS